jgi:ATP:ADP antiporter, AAA family
MWWGAGPASALSPSPTGFYAEPTGLHGAALFRRVSAHIWIGRAFFIWVSVFNLFVVSVFWFFIVDVFDGEQGKRLFGFLAAGTTLGGIAGSALTSGFVERVGQNWLLLASMLLLEVAVFASRRLSRISDAFQRAVKGEDPHKPVGGGSSLE